MQARNSRTKVSTFLATLTVAATASMATVNADNHIGVFPSAHATLAHGGTLSERARRESLLAYFSASEASRGPAERSKPFLTLFSAKVTGLDSCDGDIGLAISNSFKNGRLKMIYENFDNVLDAMMSSGGAIYLAGLYVQKSNPGLYSILTNGINLGVEDLLNGIASCEGMLNAAATFVPQSAYDAGNKTKRLEALVESGDINFQQLDIVDFFKTPAQAAGNTLTDMISKGQTYWNKDGVVTENMGGDDPSSSEPIAFVKTSAMKGYCVLRGIKADDCIVNSDPNPSEGNQVDITKDPMFQLYFGTQENRHIELVSDLSNEIYGELEVTFCDGCQMGSIAGKGLIHHFAEQRTEIADKLTEIMGYSAPVASVTSDELREVSAPRGFYMQTLHIKALEYLHSDPELQTALINGLAMDAAFIRTLWIGNFYIDAFRSIKDHSMIKSAMLDGEARNLERGAITEMDNFTRFVNQQSYYPGQYRTIAEKIVQFEGNLVSLMNWLERRNMTLGN
ncbi:hypothetical protein [Vibrio agarivorans]|uniref:Conjugal transfer protein TraH n=1 Tax=Vibrio agarivorans TaxID=153622 RepID=A0ABT7Y782_9VIBR|nr:hypothetical protein [Vibrio agarivorans]MDN2483912.1 hypothetical protein [Vibrio agarivorans]